MSKRWSEKEVILLKQYMAAGLPNVEIGAKLRRTADSIRGKKEHLLKYLPRSSDEDCFVNDSNLSDEDIINILKRDNANIRRENKRLQNFRHDALSLTERIFNRIKSHIKPLKPSKLLSPKIRKEKGVSIETPVLLLSDTHAGERVNSTECYDINEYSMDLFEERFNNVIRNTIHVLFNKMTSYHSEEIQVFLLGDIVSGNIHEELKITQDPISEVVFDTASIIAKGLDELSKHFKHVKVTCVFGNHGRMTNKRQYKRESDNWDTITYKIIERILESNKRIQMKIPESFFTIENVNGHNILAFHGHHIKSSSRYSFNGVMRDMANIDHLFSRLGKKVDTIVMGHFHEQNQLSRPEGKMFMNGSIIGPNEFSLGVGWLASNPEQTLFSVHPEKGVTWSMDIKA